MNPFSFTVQRSRTLYQGRVFQLTTKNVRFSDGARTRLDIIEHPGAVAIVPWIAKDRLILVRQIRVAANQALYEIPAGTCERGEPPKKTAQRELEEETGYRAGRLIKLMEFFPAPGFCTELMRLFVATGLTPIGAKPDPDERIRVLSVPLAKAYRMIQHGLIRDAKSIIGIWAATGRVPQRNSHGRR